MTYKLHFISALIKKFQSMQKTIFSIILLPLKLNKCGVIICTTIYINWKNLENFKIILEKKIGKKIEKIEKNIGYKIISKNDFVDFFSSNNFVRCNTKFKLHRYIFLSREWLLKAGFALAGTARVKSVPRRAVPAKKIFKSVPCRARKLFLKSVPRRAGKKPCRHGNFKLFNSKNTFKIALNKPKIGKKVFFSI